MNAARIPLVLPARVRPPTAAAGMRRARLADPLGLAGAYRVGVVIAPAGAGKTTLLAEVALSAGCPTAWLTLDDRIGDLAPFLSHLHTAVLAAVTAGRLAAMARPTAPSPARARRPQSDAVPATAGPPAGDPAAAGGADRTPTPGQGGAPEPTGAPGWASIETAIADLERSLDDDLLIVLDDLHTVQGQPAHAAVQTFLDYLPPRVRVLVAARWRPDLDLHRLRLAGQIRELDDEALRFRTWEVEELFRDCHGVRLRPDEVTTLTRSTAGWAAGLQLFHLATRGRPASERTKILSGLGNTRLTRDYLTRHVLNAVNADERDFLVQTSVFDRLTEQRCDALLGRTGSGTALADLERRGLFTFVEDDGRSYRYHEVLRAHLLEQLVLEHGEARAHEVHRAAAALCEQDGALTDAIAGYCRCGDWAAVRRLLEQAGRQLADDPVGWFELLPGSIREADPWVLLAMARRLTVNGTLAAAATAYRDAATAFGSQAPAWLLHELGELDDWLHPAPRRGATWLRALRAALADPEPHIDGPAYTAQVALIQGIAAFAGGEVALARRRFDAIAAGIGASAVIETVAAVGRAACAMLMRDESAPETADAAVMAAELLGYPAVLRVAAGIRATRVPAGRGHLLHLLEAADRAGDRWGAALIVLLGGLVGLTLTDDVMEPVDEVPAPARGGSAPADARAGSDEEPVRHRLACLQLAIALDQSALTFDELAAPALGTWARSAGLLAWRRAGRPRGERDTARIVAAGARLGPVPHALALIGSAPAPESGPAPRRHPHAAALRIADDGEVGAWVRELVVATTGRGHGSAVPPVPAVPAVSPAPHPAGSTAPRGPAPHQDQDQRRTARLVPAPAGPPVPGTPSPGTPSPGAPGPGAPGPGTPGPGTPASPPAAPDSAAVVAARPSGADPPPEATCPSTRRLAVRCFGRFEITVDGRPVDLSGVAPRNLELLALLTVHAGRPVHRDRLTGLIWPEAAGAQANHSLQVAVSALRGLLEPTVPRGQRGLLRREGQGYLLSLADPDDHDLRRFERLLEAAGAARRARDSEREHDLLVPAIELYAGEVVPAVGPTDWLVAERERLRVSAAAACERAAGICAAADRHADAVRHAERGLELDRYQDGLWRVLVRALRSAGQPAAASRAEVRYAGMLAELGIDDARAGGPQPARPERRA